MKIKFVMGESYNPYHNLAIEGELMEHAAYGMTILYLWQNEHTIVIGRNQNVSSECKAVRFLKNGGKIARRKSGGGAVYHDLGNLNFSIIYMEDDRDYLEYRTLIQETLKEFSLESEYNGRNDITVNGFKVSGNAAYTEKGVICQHGTLLIDCNIDNMVLYLTPEESKLRRNKVSSVVSRVANLKSFIPVISIESFCETMLRHTEAEPFDYKPDTNKVNALEDFFAARSWVYGGNKLEKFQVRAQ